MNNKDKPKYSRIPNFEIMRTIAMFFIVLWHSCVHGLNDAGGGSFDISSRFGVFNCLFTIFMCSITGVAVNLYVMITGYFMIDKVSFRIRRFEKIWLHTLFYALGFALLAFFISPDLLHIKIITDYFYVDLGYWFVKKYLGLILMAPFLARLASILSKWSYQFLLAVLGIINVTIYAPFATQMGDVNNGYSLQWFIFLFFIAGYIRKYEPLKGSRKVLSLFLLSWGSHFIYVLCERYLTDSITAPIPNLPYNGIIFFESYFLFLIFRDHNFKSIIWKPFVVLAPYTFGVYLIHENPFTAPHLWQGDFSPIHLINSGYLIPYIFVLSLGIFLVCSFIDSIRAFIVNRFHLANVLTAFNNYLYTRISLRFVAKKYLK